MPFIGINEQNKQRINISLAASEILEKDVVDFNLPSRNTLINSILLYNERHNNTISNKLSLYEASIKATFNNTKTQVPDSLINELVELKKDELIEATLTTGTHKRNQNSFIFRISNDVRRWLENKYNNEDNYYSSLELFINCAIEEYAKKDHYSRELVVYDSLISKLEDAINNKKWMDVSVIYTGNTSMPKEESFFPVRILPNDLRSHAYLASYEIIDDKIIAKCYRLTTLCGDLRINSSISRQISSEELNTLDQLIDERKIQFLSSTPTNIEVFLTYAGMETYKRTLPNRPSYTNCVEDKAKQGYFCTFYCTELQAKYYFLHFGKDASVISPQSLYDSFSKHYQDAYDLYS